MTLAVIIPTYNRASMVVAAVESALEQAEPTRVVVVDDGSTDDTQARLARFGDAITLVRQENRERGAARNQGARQAPEADLLLFLDADDILLPGHAAQVRALAEARPEAPLVTVPCTLTDRATSSRRPFPDSTPGPVRLEPFLLTHEAVPPSGTAVRSRVFHRVGGFEERRELAGSEDWLFTARLLAHGPGWRGEEPTVLLRRHPENTMADPDGMRRSMLLAHRLFFQNPPAGVEGMADASRARLLMRSAVGFYVAGRMRRARSDLVEALRTDPTVTLEPLVGWTFVRSLLGSRLSRWLRGIKLGRDQLGEEPGRR